MTLRNIIRTCIHLALAGSILFWAAGCIHDDSNEPSKTGKNCPHLGGKVPVDDLDPVFRVVSPNGGEKFRIGEPCTVVVTSRGPGEALFQLIVGEHSLTLPGITVSKMTPEDSMHVFIIPPAINARVFDPVRQEPVDTTISIVSDSVLVRVLQYQDYEYNDYSDCFFSILPER